MTTSRKRKREQTNGKAPELGGRSAVRQTSASATSGPPPSRQQ